MKKKLVVLILCVLTGCVSLSKTEVEQMEINKDPIEAVNLFHRYNSTLAKDQAGECVGSIILSICTLGLALPAVPYNCFSYDVENLSVPGTSFDCMNGSKSDECIVYRRTMKESKIKYFDYKRFLPESTAIKTESDFLAMVNYYDLRHLCDRLEEKTTEEKQQCKDLIEDNTRMMATKKPKCKDLYVTDVSKDYEKLLQRVASGYNWMIDHDPYGYVDILIESGYTNKSILQSAYQPVLSKQEALEESLQRLRVFADEKFCDIGDWKSDLRKAGAYL